MLGSLLIPSVASADVPPPAGMRRVGFEFTVEGLEAFPERAVFAYPCGGSHGAPMRELAVLSPGRRVSVGTRGGDCPLYSTSKAALDAWLASYAPTGTTHDPAADAFVAGAGIVRCQGGPTVRHERAASDGPAPLREVLRASRVDAGGCVVTSASGPPAPPPAKGGCAGCAVTPAGAEAVGAALAAGAALGLGLRRRASFRRH